MSKVMVPVIDLQYDNSYPLELQEELQRLGVWISEPDYTFTGRLALIDDDEETNALKDKVRAAVREHCPEDATRFLSQLEEYNWDISFFVDTW